MLDKKLVWKDLGSRRLIILAANAGVEAQNKTPKQVRAEFERIRSKEFSDQHDVLLDQELKRLGF